ncbi:MAG: peptidoglycan/xylan/chitin deacetylase (PgdA/CDA1 family) [Candidatus Krumholzibacteriia bacterium]|jgi:peptidoglycan/xylan/chitin deacetylase (PgdA/CDA1 family)
MVTSYRRSLFSLTMICLLACLGVASCSDSGTRNEDSEIGTFFTMESSSDALGLIPEFQDGIPILCYHYFRSSFNPAYLARVFTAVIFGAPTIGDREFWTTPIGEFERHLRYFRDNNIQVVTLDEVADLLDAGLELPERAVVLTIDDADESVYRLAWPLLKKYNVRAHLFVPTGRAGSQWSELQVSSWDQLREMESSGNIIVGSHSRDMHYKTKTRDGWEPIFWHPDRVPEATRALNLADVMRYRRQGSQIEIDAEVDAALTGGWSAVAADLLASRYDIERELNHAPDWLAWPYGFAESDLDSIGKMVGFRGTVSLAPLNFAEEDSTLTPGRYTITAKTTLEMIKSVLPPQ